MDWPLVRRGLFVYSLLAGGVTVGVVVAVLGTGFGPVVTVAIGLVALLYVAGGSGDVRMGTIATNASAGGLDTGVVDDAEGMSTSVPADVKVAFYAVGLLVLSVAVVVGSVVL